MSPTSTLSAELETAAYNRDEHFAAHFLGVKVQTLRSWRQRSQTGPPFRKINGKLVKYSVASLAAWVAAQPLGGQAS